MKKYILSRYTIIKETFQAFIGNNGPKYSAALAYYTIFSLAPMMIIIIWVGGRFLGEAAIEGKIYDEIKDFIGPSAALQIQEMIKNVSIYEDDTFATAIGFGTLFVGATIVFTEIQDTLNIIWGIKAKPKRGLLKFLTNRLISFSMVIGIGFLMLVSLGVNALISIFSEFIKGYIGQSYLPLFHILNFLLTFFIITVLIIFIFKFLPDAKIRWKDVTAGAIATSLLFMVGKFAIGLYLSHTDIASAYGAAGSLILVLVWVYYSSIILFFGAEFTQVYSRHYGTKIIPREYAVLIEKKEIEIENSE
ncbi:MAG TPA: YihY/virulence factor BrkB family protein [Bacteroidia bacterium]|nr:YihY/virulence factor BrkB family protein [Bacteroidia bacterium]